MNPKESIKSSRLAEHGKQAGPAKRDSVKKQINADARQVFIDLDDAYGVPFFATAISPQAYGNRRERNQV